MYNFLDSTFLACWDASFFLFPDFSCVKKLLVADDGFFLLSIHYSILFVHKFFAIYCFLLKVEHFKKSLKVFFLHIIDAEYSLLTVWYPGTVRYQLCLKFYLFLSLRIWCLNLFPLCKTSSELYIVCQEFVYFFLKKQRIFFLHNSAGYPYSYWWTKEVFNKFFLYFLSRKK